MNGYGFDNGRARAFVTGHFLIKRARNAQTQRNKPLKAFKGRSKRKVNLGQ